VCEKVAQNVAKPFLLVKINTLLVPWKKVGRSIRATFLIFKTLPKVNNQPMVKKNKKKTQSTNGCKIAQIGSP
jgi:hypothetical protein